MSRISKSIQTRYINVCPGLGENQEEVRGEGEWGVTSTEYGIFFLGDICFKIRL